MSWHMKPKNGFTRPLDLACVALPQSPSKQQQQPLHRNSTVTKGLLVSSRLKTLQMKKNARRRAPGRSRNRWIYSTCGSPTISPVDAPAANSASKLNKSKGTSGLVSYLPKSIAWLHDCMTPFWDFRTRKDILGCKRRIALCILCSVFKHPLSPDHVCTCNWGANVVGWHKLVFLQLSRRKSCGMAQLMISIASICSTSDSSEKACYCSNPSVGVAHLTGGKVCSKPNRVCKKPRPLMKHQQRLLKMTAPISTTLHSSLCGAGTVDAKMNPP